MNQSKAILNKMRSFMKKDQFKEALSLYEDCHFKTDRMHLFAIKCCQKANSFELGKQIISSNGLSGGENIFLSTALIDFYGHFADISSAFYIFERMEYAKRTPIFCNAMMTALMATDFSEDGMAIYFAHSHLHSDVSHLLALRACVKTQNRLVDIDNEYNDDRLF